MDRSFRQEIDTMIRSIEIKGLRGIQDGKLDDLTPLVVLVGANGSGKSTILDALLIGASPDPSDAIGRVVRRRTGVRLGARWLLWRAGVSGPSTIRVTTAANKVRACSLSLDPNSPAQSPAIGADALTDQENGTSHNRVRTEFVDGNEYRYTPHKIELFGVPDVGIVEFDGSDQQIPLYELITRARELGHRHEANEIVGAVVPGLVDVPILTEGDSPLVYLEFEDHAVPVAVSGEGVRDLVRLSYELAARPDGLVLLEEPEVHQHPASMHQSARAIWAAVRRDVQVILTTHSLELIDALLSEVKDDEEREKLSVYRTLLKEGCLITSRLTGTDAALLRSAIEDDLR